mmetsp:Transcript_8302/g.10510  ORF Transcript_8302/g.10510 Transcript_8302/m.10510 type:complete len:201 (+) Transcript_8302:552-1154(+)
MHMMESGSLSVAWRSLVCETVFFRDPRFDHLVSLRNGCSRAAEGSKRFFGSNFRRLKIKWTNALEWAVLCLSSHLVGRPSMADISLSSDPFDVRRSSSKLKSSSYKSTATAGRFGPPFRLFSFKFSLEAETMFCGSGPRIRTNRISMSWDCDRRVKGLCPPGKQGLPVNNSARIHPRLHMSTSVPYPRPSMTSGARYHML